MRILIVVPSLSSGGAERVAANLAKMWSQTGHDVSLLTFSGREADFYDLDERVRRVTLSASRPSTNLFRVVRNSLHRALAIRREVQSSDVNLVVALMPAANVLAAFASIGLNVCTIGCEHTHPPMQPLGRIRELTRKLAYRRLSAVVALTERSHAWLKKNTWAKLVATIPNPAVWPLPVGRPIHSPSSVCADGRKILLSVGRLDPVKGFPTLISCFAAIADARADWDLVILGEGKLRSELETLVRTADLGSRVFLPGRVGNVADWYKRAQLYVMTSNYEGFPSTLIEAMSHGLAAVSFDCETGPRDIIRNGIDGVLVEDRNAPALSEALLGLTDNLDARTRMAAAAVDVVERFSEAKVRSRWDDLFAQLNLTPRKRHG